MPIILIAKNIEPIKLAENRSINPNNYVLGLRLAISNGDFNKMKEFISTQAVLEGAFFMALAAGQTRIWQQLLRNTGDGECDISDTFNGFVEDVQAVAEHYQIEGISEPANFKINYVGLIDVKRFQEKAECSPLNNVQQASSSVGSIQSRPKSSPKKSSRNWFKNLWKKHPVPLSIGIFIISVLVIGGLIATGLGIAGLVTAAAAGAKIGGVALAHQAATGIHGLIVGMAATANAPAYVLAGGLVGTGTGVAVAAVLGNKYKQQHKNNKLERDQQEGRSLLRDSDTSGDDDDLSKSSEGDYSHSSEGEVINNQHSSAEDEKKNNDASRCATKNSVVMSNSVLPQQQNTEGCGGMPVAPNQDGVDVTPQKALPGLGGSNEDPSTPSNAKLITQMSPIFTNQEAQSSDEPEWDVKQQNGADYSTTPIL